MTRILPSDESGLKQAAHCLRQGNLVAFATETVYGLGGNALDAEAIALIYQTKSRPQHNPLIVHIAHPDEAAHYAVMTPLTQNFIARGWPEAVTLVLKARASSPLPPALISVEGSIALRLPSHRTARALIALCGTPLAAPSANISGKLSPTRAHHVQAQFAHLPQPKLILDDSDPCRQGLESTIIDMRGDTPKILRHGAYLLEADSAPLSPSPIAPGMLPSHYAPETPLRLNADTAQNGERMLGFGAVAGAHPDDLNLSPDSSLDEAARNFYDYLFRLDRLTPQAIAVAPIPMQGLGIAINDRLRRASAQQG